MADLILSRLRRTLQNWFTTKIGFEGSEQASAPTQPASGYRQLYAKSDGWYDQDDGGTETKIGSGGAGLPDTFEGTAGEALDQYDVVYSNSADSGEHWIATNDGTSVEADAVGMVVESGGIADTATGTIHRLGPLTNEAWTWTPGATLWLGTDGAMTETMPSAGSYAKPLGWAVTATKIWFDPQTGWLVGFDVELTEVPAINDGRLTLVSSSQIKWDGYRVSLWDPSVGRDVECIPSSTPVLNYNDNELYYDEALAAGYAYDVYLEFASATSASLKAVRWVDTPSTTRYVTPALWHGRERYDNTTDTGKKRLWVGTVYLDTGPVFVDAKNTRFIWNKYNQKNLELGYDCPHSSETYQVIGASWTAISNYIVKWVSGEETLIELSTNGLVGNSSWQTLAFSLDSTNDSSNDNNVGLGSTSNVGSPRMCSQVAAGYHYSQLLAKVDAGTGNFYQYNATYAFIQHIRGFMSA